MWGFKSVCKISELLTDRKTRSYFTHVKLIAVLQHPGPTLINSSFACFTAYPWRPTLKHTNKVLSLRCKRGISDKRGLELHLKGKHV